MQIQLVKNADNLTEWMIIELQGTIELGPGARSLEGQRLGQLEWGADWKCASLTLGHQLLEGRLEELEKPYLVLNRDSLSLRKACEEQKVKQCDVVAVVRKKLVFSERPKPIIKVADPAK
uniref:Ctf8 n=1 Tax=Globodera pallida TaxID=36090 RepID=A0A183C397_GLOPA